MRIKGAGGRGVTGTSPWGQRGLGELWGHGNGELWGHGNGELWGHGDTGMWGHGRALGSWGQDTDEGGLGDVGTWESFRDKGTGTRMEGLGTRGRGDMELGRASRIRGQGHGKEDTGIGTQMEDSGTRGHEAQGCGDTGTWAQACRAARTRAATWGHGGGAHWEGFDGPDDDVPLGDVAGSAGTGLEPRRVGVAGHRNRDLHAGGHRLLLELPLGLPERHLVTVTSPHAAPPRCDGAGCHREHSAIVTVVSDVTATRTSPKRGLQGLTVP